MRSHCRGVTGESKGGRERRRKRTQKVKALKEEDWVAFHGKVAMANTDALVCNERGQYSYKAFCADVAAAAGRPLKTTRYDEHMAERATRTAGGFSRGISFVRSMT